MDQLSAVSSSTTNFEKEIELDFIENVAQSGYKARRRSVYSRNKFIVVLFIAQSSVLLVLLVGTHPIARVHAFSHASISREVSCGIPTRECSDGLRSVCRRKEGFQLNLWDTMTEAELKKDNIEVSSQSEGDKLLGVHDENSVTVRISDILKSNGTEYLQNVEPLIELNGNSVCNGAYLKKNGIVQVRKASIEVASRNGRKETISHRVKDYKPRKFETSTKDAPKVNKHTAKVETKNTTAKLSSEKSSAERTFWKRRHARSIEEGIRRETTSTSTKELSSLLKDASVSQKEESNGRRYAARTITGLVTALAEEAHGLDVEVDAREDTPFWEKHVDFIRINFSRLTFKPLRVGGLNQAIEEFESEITVNEKERLTQNLREDLMLSADEAFDRIDADKSGALDEAEIATALRTAAKDGNDASSQELLNSLASKLVKLYDIDQNGLVDREEYLSMVEDMAALRRTQKKRNVQRKKREAGKAFQKSRGGQGWRSSIRNRFRRRKQEIPTSTESPEADDGSVSDEGDTYVEKDEIVAEKFGESDVTSFVRKKEQVTGAGSIVFSDLKLDLRRLVFGAIPILKRIVPGGPLILEPFTATVTGSFSREDILESFLLDAGLRRLVARVLRRRVRSFRELVDGAVFYGRTWNMASKSAPVIEVPKLTNVEFDKRDKIIITGRARIRASPGDPFIDNAFKIRARLGTREDGHVIRLKDPELALVIECPKAWERNIESVCKKLHLPIPGKPKPIYRYIPLISPFKVTDKDGYNMGPDNSIKSIYIKDGALRFKMRAVLRPGRFLGSHYLAFSLPNRTFIVTLDKVREGIRVARRNKLAADRAVKEAEEKRKRRIAKSFNEVIAQSLSSQELVSDEITANEQYGGMMDVDGVSSAKKTDQSFFSRFVEGYMRVDEVQDELRNQRLTEAISDWFGRQGVSRLNSKSQK